MKKQYMIGEKNGQKFVAHGTQVDILDGAMVISKAEYRRHRAAGVPSWGESQTTDAKARAHDPKRAARWAARTAVSHAKTQKMKRECRDNRKKRIQEVNGEQAAV